MNTKLKRSLVLAIILLASAASYAETELKYPGVPSIKTITMGSSVSVVLEKLGVPQKTVTVPPSEMGRPESQELSYRGLRIGVYRSSAKKEPHVWSVRVNGEKIFIYPGITIGMRRGELIALLGKPYSEEMRQDEQWLHWVAPDPVEIFHVRIKNGRVIEFAMMEDWS